MCDDIDDLTCFRMVKVDLVGTMLTREMGVAIGKGVEEHHAHSEVDEEVVVLVWVLVDQGRGSLRDEVEMIKGLCLFYTCIECYGQH